MKSQESVTVVGKKLYDMLEKSKNNEEFTKYSSKKVISSTSKSEDDTNELTFDFSNNR